ncbi:MAG: 2-C-methyl-D-erythritol 2,4-cyclodiphosphate synthase [Coriobacteriales bacterium]|nr:2-C-methyl-D-erythritol 2,4-cyclodiphosphate synthase [Coriobacteriales bacterium]
MRIGLGIDVHAFAAEGAHRPLILGGVRIPHSRGLLGHSDADVLTHAVMDALLGAARLGDIGRHFPDTSSAFRDADSLALLRQVGTLLARAHWQIEDLDCVIIAQQPQLSPYRDEMAANIAAALEVEPSFVGIKATTSEHLGFEGREEGISAYAVALLQPAD